MKSFRKSEELSEFFSYSVPVGIGGGGGAPLRAGRRSLAECGRRAAGPGPVAFHPPAEVSSRT